MAVAGARHVDDCKILSGEKRSAARDKTKRYCKSFTINCVRLTEESKKLKAKTTKQTKDVEFYKGRMRQQSSELKQLQEKADDFERVKQYVGAAKIDAIVVNERELEKFAHKEKWHNKIYGISR